MQPQELESIEIDLLLEALFRAYGYDFRSYARASVERRIRQFVTQKKLDRPSELIPLVLHDEELFSELAQQFSVSVTEMFRDPFVYRSLREKVVPVLKTYPYVKVWAAGCATGEEVYSLAIVLEEAGILERSTIYGTDFNDSVLEKARHGIYSPEAIQQFTRSYQESGGKQSFSKYYNARYDAVSIASTLKDRITFANHNLTADADFGEMHLIFCRNVLIYFNEELRERALKIFTDSLVRGGFLILGTKEDLRFSRVFERFESFDAKAKIYKKRSL